MSLERSPARQGKGAAAEQPIDEIFMNQRATAELRRPVPFAVRIVAARHALPLDRAALICELAGIGAGVER